jgi:hypothetical protein
LENCTDGKDNNCDGTVDEGCAVPVAPVGGGAAPAGEPPEAELEFPEGEGQSVSVEMTEGSTAYYTFKGERHGMTVDEVTGTEAHVSFESIPPFAVLRINDFVYVDFDEDGWNDIKVTLRRIRTGVATFDIELRPQPEPEVEPPEFVEVAKPEVPAPEIVEEEVPLPISKTKIVLFIVVAAALVILVSDYMFHTEFLRTPRKLLRLKPKVKPPKEKVTLKTPPESALEKDIQEDAGAYVKAYVATARADGYNDEMIHDMLVNDGWPKKLIKKALKK